MDLGRVGCWQAEIITEAAVNVRAAVAELEELGFRVAIFPASGFLAATEALSRVYAALRDTGASTADGAPLYAFKDFIALMGFDEVLDFESRYD